jgi:hypothetical protein
VFFVCFFITKNSKTEGGCWIMTYIEELRKSIEEMGASTKESEKIAKANRKQLNEAKELLEAEETFALELEAKKQSAERVTESIADSELRSQYSTAVSEIFCELETKGSVSATCEMNFLKSLISLGETISATHAHGGYTGVALQEHERLLFLAKFGEAAITVLNRDVDEADDIDVEGTWDFLETQENKGSWYSKHLKQYRSAYVVQTESADDLSDEQDDDSDSLDDTATANTPARGQASDESA